MPGAHPGEIVRAHRLALRLSQGALGERVGRSQSWVSAVEEGRIGLSLTQASAVAAALGQDLAIFRAESA